MFQYLDERVRHLTLIDIGLIKLAVLCMALIIIKLLPQLLMINFTVLIILVVLFSAKPVYAFWFKS